MQKDLNKLIRKFTTFLNTVGKILNYCIIMYNDCISALYLLFLCVTKINLRTVFVLHCIYIEHEWCDGTKSSKLTIILSTLDMA